VSTMRPFHSETTEEVLRFRSLFPILERWVYLNSCAKGALAKQVRAAYLQFLADWDEQGGPWQLWMGKADELRARFARFIGAQPHEIALTLSASSGATSIASAMEYGKRRKIVMGDQEYPTMGQVWLAQVGSGASVQFVESRGRAHPSPEDYGKVVDNDTLIVPLTHVSFRNGSTLPVRDITEVCHRRGAYVLLDDYQCTGTRPIDVKYLGIDFLVSGMVKYMLGPPGIGFLYVREELIQELHPRVTGWFGRRDPFSLDLAPLSYSDTAQRFETGTFPVGAIYASLAALDLLSAFGPIRVAEQIAKITQRVLAETRDLGFNVTTPRESEGPMVSIETDEVFPLVAFLRERNILIAGRNNLFRVSFHAYNTMDDAVALIAAMAEWRERRRRPA
jgi:kynureninase